MDISRQEQIRRKRIGEEALRREADQDHANMVASIIRAEEAERRDAEKAQALRTETMLANKVTMEEMARKREREHAEKDLIQRQIQNDERTYRTQLERQKQGIGVGDLI